MEKALGKVGSIKVKAGSYWISKKAKQELSNISDDLTEPPWLKRMKRKKRFQIWSDINAGVEVDGALFLIDIRGHTWNAPTNHGLNIVRFACRSTILVFDNYQLTLDLVEVSTCQACLSGSNIRWVTPRKSSGWLPRTKTFSSTVEEKAKWIFNKLKGKPVKSLPELLREYNLPPGLFPNNIVSYEFDETKAKLVVYLPSTCEVTFKDSSVIRYATRVKGILLRGKLTNIEGMKTKVLVWIKVTNVAVEGYRSDKVWFTAGVKKSRTRDAYDLPRDAHLPTYLRWCYSCKFYSA
ncbi:hypothetical protein CTI12_AA128880 [Artemisia annua]|uniref:DUF538 domain-containing protein n=1 Tax=Artemisia annua TaxID=35608 RepID=A0A2U1PP34_ARTAN|nr:hypothetical protein CTI12_AA128880 [Artemisia annua]